MNGVAGDAVSGVDQATGGALGASGVGATAEEAVNGVDGPGSTVGDAVDKAAGTVGDLPE